MVRTVSNCSDSWGNKKEGKKIVERFGHFKSRRRVDPVDHGIRDPTNQWPSILLARTNSRDAQNRLGARNLGVPSIWKVVECHLTGNFWGFFPSML
jgi:hypothetical protein